MREGGFHVEEFSEHVSQALPSSVVIVARVSINIETVFIDDIANSASDVDEQVVRMIFDVDYEVIEAAIGRLAGHVVIRCVRHARSSNRKAALISHPPKILPVRKRLEESL